MQQKIYAENSLLEKKIGKINNKKKIEPLTLTKTQSPRSSSAILCCLDRRLFKIFILSYNYYNVEEEYTRSSSGCCPVDSGLWCFFL